MKFAVITDIHGNYPALKAILEEIDNNTSIVQIYCLGDLIAIGPDTNQVLEAVFSRQDTKIITGNHDEAVLALLQGEQHPQSHRHVKEHHQWIADRLNPKYLEQLLQLPRAIEETIGDKKIIFTHYHIEAKKFNKPISEDPFSRIVEPSLGNLEELFKDIQADLICFGHHHPVHFYQNDSTIFLNPGSLGCNSISEAAYAIVNVTNENIEIELKSVPYDNKKFLMSYEELQVPEREFILKVFHGASL